MIDPITQEYRNMPLADKIAFVKVSISNAKKQLSKISPYYVDDKLDLQKSITDMRANLKSLEQKEESGNIPLADKIYCLKAEIDNAKQKLLNVKAHQVDYKLKLKRSLIGMNRYLNSLEKDKSEYNQKVFAFNAIEIEKYIP